MTPDARSYNILIKGYARAGLLSLLPDLVADMQMEVAYLTPIVQINTRADTCAAPPGHKFDSVCTRRCLQCKENWAETRSHDSKLSTVAD